VIHALTILMALCLTAGSASAGHIEAEGLVLKSGGKAIASAWQGVATGEIEVHHEEWTEAIEVFFLDPDSTEFQPSEPEFSLGAVLDDPLIAGYEQLSTWSFRLEGLEEGMTDLTLSILHEGHSDFTAPPIEVHVEEHHAEAEGLLIMQGANEIVRVWQGVVTGEIGVHLGETTPALAVFFLDVDGDEFLPEGEEFSLGAEIGSPALAGYGQIGDWSFSITGLQAGETDLTLAILHEGHSDFTSPPIPILISPNTASDSSPPVTRLLQNAPNPFNPKTRIHFQLAAPQRVSLVVLDVRGARVRSLLSNESLGAGSHAVEWDGRDGAGRPVASGAYYYRLDTPSVSALRSMVLLK
jgi:hypothetical protein